MHPTTGTFFFTSDLTYEVPQHTRLQPETDKFFNWLASNSAAVFRGHNVERVLEVLAVFSVTVPTQ